MELIEELQKKIDSLEKKVEGLLAENERLRRGKHMWRRVESDADLPTEKDGKVETCVDRYTRRVGIFAHFPSDDSVRFIHYFLNSPGSGAQGFDAWAPLPEYPAEWRE